MSVTSFNLSSNNRKIEIGYFVIMNTTNYNNENEYCKITVARRICTFLRLRNVERNKIAELGPERSEGPSVAILLQTGEMGNSKYWFTGRLRVVAIHSGCFD